MNMGGFLALRKLTGLSISPPLGIFRNDSAVSHDYAANLDIQMFILEEVFSEVKSPLA